MFVKFIGDIAGPVSVLLTGRPILLCVLCEDFDPFFGMSPVKLGKFG